MTNPPTKLTKNANNNPPTEYKHNPILVKKALIEYMYNIYRTQDVEQKKDDVYYQKARYENVRRREKSSSARRGDGRPDRTYIE